MKINAILAVAMLQLAACGSSSAPPTTSEFPVGLQPRQSIEIQGQQRDYRVFLPKGPTSARVVFLLHGNRGSSDQILGLDGTKAPHKFWMDIALRENLILVVPDGAVGSEGHQGWNDCRSDAPTNPVSDDVLFVNTLIDEVSIRYRTPENKVFVVGTSNGGIMSMRLADEIPEKLHAFAAVVASRPVNNKCTVSPDPVSALFMNGTDDPILPYNGGHIKPMRGELFSTADAVAYWVNRNQTNTAIDAIELTDSEPDDDSTVKVYSYLDGLNSTRVMHYEVVGGGHTEPSIGERYSAVWKLVVGEQNNDIETAEEIWRFFASL